MKTFFRSAMLAVVVSGAALTVSAQVPLIDISLEHDQANAQLLIYLRANDQDFGQVMSNVVFTVRWPDSSPATLGIGASEWCPPPNQALNLAASASVTPGNGFRYRTWTSIGLTQIAEVQDDGGCAQSLLANEWAHVLTIPVNADPGDTAFEIAADGYTEQENRGYYVSLNGLAATGSIFTFSTGVEVLEASITPQLILYPSPAAQGSQVTISEAGSAGDWNAQLIDGTGRLGFQERGTQWPPRFTIGNWAHGIYSVRFEHDGRIRYGSLTIE